MSEPVFSMSPEDRDKYDMQLVQNAINVLIEHFDAVQVFVSRHEGRTEGTMRISHGEGNYFARQGQVKEWIERVDEGSRVAERRRNGASDGSV